MADMSLRRSSRRPQTVQQNFSHGRSNAVVVETRKKRIARPGEKAKESVFAPKIVLNKKSVSDGKSALSSGEQAARAKALKQEAETKQKAADKTTQNKTTAKAKAKPRRQLPTGKKFGIDDSAKEKQEQKSSRGRGGESKRRTKLTLSNALIEDAVRFRSLSSVRRQRAKQKRNQQVGPREKVMREVTVPDTISIQELANRMTERAVDVVKLLMKQGQMLKPGDIIDADMAQLIAEEMGHTVIRVSESDIETGLGDEPDNEADMQTRAAIVTIMGHVDHGKTSLLDKLRQTRVAESEAGGITQNIGAYQLMHNEKPITFLDTPGHEAFTAMRARGANITDIAILVVAADDGIMPQTIESIKHAKAANVPLIIAINKMDVEGADSGKVRNQLLQHEIVTEKMGGETLDVEISAKQGEGLDSLLDAILLQAELLELRANPNRQAQGTVVESQLDKGRGAVALALINRGTLNKGDIIVAGNEWGRVRAIISDSGEKLEQVGPATPCEILGLSGAPLAGDKLIVVGVESRAREIAEYRTRKARELEVAAQAGKRGSLEQMMSNLTQKNNKQAQFVIKADTQGCVGAIQAAIDELANDEIKVEVVHGGVGGITETDISLAIASSASILAFNVRANRQANELAKRESVEINYHSVIYDLVEHVKNRLSGLLEPTRKESFIGYAEILETFDVSKIGKVAGCLVTEGRVERGAGVRLLRDDIVVHEGELSTLQRFKDEVAQVESGVECGMGFKGYDDIRKGDKIECFTVELVKRQL